MKKSMLYIVFLTAFQMWSQQQVSLKECYNLITINYPLAKQSTLLVQQQELGLQVISADKLPQFNFTAQATYQSDVTEIPLPNTGIEPLNKEQYRVMLSINQLIYDGGLINARATVKKAALSTQQKQVEVSVYQLKKQLNQLYFSVLLLQEKDKLLHTKQEQLKAQLKEVKSGIKYGVVLPASDKVIEVELLKIKQQFTEIESNKSVLIATISSLIGKSLDATTVFQEPVAATNLSPTLTLNRPELEMFQLKKEEVESSEQLLSKKNTPKLLGFAKGGYGNPGLNMLDNSFQSFYTIGLKLNWNVFDWNATKKQRESIAINKDLLDSEAEVFKLNINIELNQLQTEIKKISAFIETDTEIISLRKEVLKSAISQLQNGVITASAYITELTNLYENQSTLIMHSIQLELAKANYNITKG